MKITASHLGNLVLTILLFFCLALWAQDSFAADSEEQIMDGKVEVIYPAEETAAFRERKENSSIIFGIVTEQPEFTKFRSKIDGSSYLSLFGHSPVVLVQGELGLKYNTTLGGFGVSAFYGGGEVSDGRSGEMTTLTLRRKGVSASLFLDSLFREPYVVPYVAGQFFNWDWDEETMDMTTRSKRTQSGSTQFTSGFKGGVLFQLNWLDPDSALQARNSSHLNNAFLDLFVSQSNPTSGDDPDFQTDTTYGGGLKLEF